MLKFMVEILLICDAGIGAKRSQGFGMLEIL
ncbi:MAG: CRISPR-associated endoribonuclease Cas6 [Smithella sp.]